uniref:Uncharacterized protein n=1 Tax=Cannabis sativa TaxID=3483 RepID=A0A803NKX6_CANSA
MPKTMSSPWSPTPQPFLGRFLFKTPISTSIGGVVSIRENSNHPPKAIFIVDMLMSHWPDSHRLASEAALDGDEDQREDSFIPTSILRGDRYHRRYRLGPMSSADIKRMVQSSRTRAIEIRDSLPTVETPTSRLHSKHAPDAEVEEMDDDYGTESQRGRRRGVGSGSILWTTLTERALLMRGLGLRVTNLTLLLLQG